MAKIQFDIKFRPQIESSDYKVETQNGCIARIICWDRKDNNYPIVALFEEEISGKECLLSYTQNGQHVKGTSNVSDLFIVTPEPEMSEWELAIAKYRPPTDSKETIQRIAAELLSLAREQLQPEIDAEIEKAYKNADEVQYKKGRKDLLQEIFKDSSTEELEKELKIFHDIFKNKDCSAAAIRNWSQLFRSVAQKEYFVKTNLTASETIKESLRTEYEKGRADALKDLPRWRKIRENGRNYSDSPQFVINGRYLEMNDTLNDVYEIALSDLEKLQRRTKNEI